MPRSFVALLVLLSVSVSWAFGVTGAVAAPPDGRRYELVTPPDLAGPAIPPVFAFPGVGQPWNLVSADGSAVLWSVLTPPPGIDATGYLNTFISRRDASGWTSSFVSPPGSKILGGSPFLFWATADLQRLLWAVSDATIDPTDHDSVDPTGPYGDVQYVDFYRRDADGTFTRVTQGSIAPPVPGEQPTLIGISTDGLKVVFDNDRQLEPDAAGRTVYERVGNRTVVVNKDENGNPVPLAGGHAVSDDGNLVAFGGNANEMLYLRDVAAGQTTLVASTPGNPIGFEALSSSGKRMVFTTTAQLTPDDVDNSRDLYEYDMTAASLKRISAPTGAPSVQGPGNTDACAAPVSSCDVVIVTVSRDGSKVYFISPEQLDGTRGTDGGSNLYLNENGDVRFVATLDPSDPVTGGSPAERHVRFTPDGAKLMLESRAALTGYDNAGHTEVYVHAPAADSLICASCRPSGAPPTGDASLREGPGAQSPTEFPAAAQSPANADEHGDRIFFQSSDALVPQDTNGRFDVYEYNVSNASTALISSGVSPNDSAYLGNGIDGKDVFFVTTDVLAPQDHSGSIFKVYDARMGGGIAFSPELPRCTGEGCRGSRAPDPDVVSPGTTQATGTRRPLAGPAASKLTVSGTRSVTGTSIRLTATVSGAGRLQVTGSGVVAASVKTSRVASYHVTVKLSKASVAKLKLKHRLAVSATVRFTPSAGTARSLRVRLTFKIASKKGR